MSAFSNGTEFEAWSAAWCETCVGSTEGNCKILLELLINNDSEKIKRGPLWSPQTVNYCLAYEMK